MKKLLYLVAGCIIFMQCHKDSGLDPATEPQEKLTTLVVTKDEAIAAAKLYLIQSRLRVASKNQRTVSKTDTIVTAVSVKTVNDDGGEPLVHIVSLKSNTSVAATDGFVVVSGDKRAMPVLAFSEKGTFDPERPGAKIWLNHAKNIFVGIKSKYAQPGKWLLEQWNEFEGKGQRTSGGKDPGTTCSEDSFYDGPILMNTEWAQDETYNNYCPLRSCGPCGRSVAGCGAVAVAQIYNYHHKPTSNTYTTDAPAITYTFPMNIARNSAVCNPTDAGDLQIANLIRVAGENAEVGYNVVNCNSFNWRDDIKTGFQNAGYSNKGTRNTWDATTRASVITDLKFGYPSVMDGTTQFLGFEDWHFWNLQGVREHIYWDEIYENGIVVGCHGYTYLWFHLNWGWNGDDNGWYALGNFVGDGEVYDTSLNVTYNIRP